MEKFPFLRRSYTYIEMQWKIVSVPNKLIMLLSRFRYSKGWCRISDKLPASIFREVRGNKFPETVTPSPRKFKGSHYRGHSQLWEISISHSLLILLQILQKSHLIGLSAPKPEHKVTFAPPCIKKLKVSTVKIIRKTKIGNFISKNMAAEYKKATWRQREMSTSLPVRR